VKLIDDEVADVKVGALLDDPVDQTVCLLDRAYDDVDGGAPDLLAL
jgi:hypothetical protein